MNGSHWKASLYRFSYRYHLWFWRVWWIPFAGAAFLGLVVVGRAAVPEPLPVVFWISLVLAATLAAVRLLIHWTQADTSDWEELTRPGTHRPWWEALPAMMAWLFPARLWWSLFAGVAALCAIALGSTVASPSLPVWFWIGALLVAALMVCWLLAFLLWLGISSWHSVWFRYLVWWSAVACGKLRRWLLTGWRGAIVMLAAVTVMMWVYSQLVGSRRQLIEFLTPDLALRVIAVTVILVLLYWASGARRRIVVVSFTDYTGDPGLKTYAESIGSQLRNDLDGLCRLYRVIEDTPERPVSKSQENEDAIARAIGGGPLLMGAKRGVAIDASVVAETGQTLQGIVSSDSKIKLGVLEIPVGALMAVVGRVMEGPRVTGSLHRTGDQLVLMATLGGGGLSGSWRVSQNDVEAQLAATDRRAGEEKPSAGAGTEPVARMVEQMAYRIYTDLERESLGSPRWRAVYFFTDGLRAYRETLRTQRNYSLNLHRAERAFLEALAEDEGFAQCHYNLGIVYSRLNRPDSAREAFARAVRQNPRLADAHYALALDAWSCNRYDEAVHYCDQMIQLQPHEARAWSLQGLALSWIYSESLGSHRKHDVALARLRARLFECYAIAVALAWLALWRSAYKVSVTERQKATAFACVRLMVYALGYFSFSYRDRPGSAPLRQAMHLAPENADFYFYYLLAETLTRERNWTSAGRALTEGLRAVEDLDELIFVTQSLHKWFSPPGSARKSGRPPARLYSELGDEAAKAWQRVLRGSWTLTEDSFDQVLLILSMIQAPSIPLRSLVHYQCMRRWLQKKQQDIADERLDYQTASGQLGRRLDFYRQAVSLQLERGLSSYRQHNWKWAGAQVAVQLAEWNLADRPAEAEEYLEQAVEWLKEDSVAEIQGRELLANLALACLAQDKMEKALYWAEQAVALDPENALERQVLGRVYFALNDYERARAELTMSLNLDPENSETMRLIALTYWYRSVSLHEPKERQAAFSQAVTALKQILQVVENQNLDAEYLLEQIQARSWAHFGLGWFYGEQAQYDAAIAHFRIALAAGYKPLETRVYIGYTYWRARAYEPAEQSFREAAVEALRHYHKLKTLAKFDPVVGEEEPIHIWLVEAHLYSALALAERGVNMKQALRRASHALRHVVRMSDLEDHSEYMAVYFECMGWIYFRSAQLSQDVGDAQKALWLNRAILDLEHSASLLADPDTWADTYYRLAQVYSAQAQHDSARKDHWQAKAKEAALHCREADLRGEYTAEMDKLLQPPKPDPKPDLSIEINRKDVPGGSASQ